MRVEEVSMFECCTGSADRSILSSWRSGKGFAGLFSSIFLFLLPAALGVKAFGRADSFEGDTIGISSSSKPSPYGSDLFFLGVVTWFFPSSDLMNDVFPTPSLTTLWRCLICSLLWLRSFSRNCFSIAIFCCSSRAFSTSTLYLAASSARSFCNVASFCSLSFSSLFWFARTTAISPVFDETSSLAELTASWRV